MSNLTAIWKQVTTTTLRTTHELYELLKQRGHTKTFRTDDIVHKAKLLGQGAIIPLYRVTVLELGLKHGGSYWEIREAAEKLGFELIPLEVLLQLRLDYIDQPLDEVIYGGTKTFSFPGQRRAIFGIVNDYLGMRFCIEETMNSGDYFSKHTLFVFTKKLPKEKTAP